MISRSKGDKQYAVLGLGKFGMSVARELSTAGIDVLAIDNNEERVAEAKSFCTYAVKADVCDTGTLESLGIADMDGVVVSITGDHNASIIATITAKEAGVPFIVAKSSDAVHSRILEKVGADRVIIPEKESGIRVARSLSSGRLLDFIELSERVRLVELDPRPEWIGKKLGNIRLREQGKVSAVALRKSDGELITAPDPDLMITKKCTLILMADLEAIDRLTAE